MQETIQTSKNSNSNSNCFYLCGLTGGPYFPMPAIMKQIQIYLPEAIPILVGVQNSYESAVAKRQNLLIEYLPKVKLDILSFKNSDPIEIFVGICKAILGLFGLVFSFFKSIYLIVKYQPKLIYSTGSFLSVPMLWACKLTNSLRISNSIIIIHQQDAVVGLANKLTIGLANLKSCVFQYTRSNYKQFVNVQTIPNPIIESRYNSQNLWSDQKLENFVKNTHNPNPLLLIFGGGSGALILNNWVNDNIDILTTKFRVVHLTGILQESVQQKPQGNFENQNLKGKLQVGSNREFKFDNPNYFSQIAVIEDMPTLLASVDIVICRAGLGSISELGYLNKPTFLVPIPNTHQEQNALLVAKNKSSFKILDQNNQDQWLNQITTTTFKTSNISDFDNNSLDKYYLELQKLLAST